MQSHRETLQRQPKRTTQQPATHGICLILSRLRPGRLLRAPQLRHRCCDLRCNPINYAPVGRHPRSSPLRARSAQISRNYFGSLLSRLRCAVKSRLLRLTGHGLRHVIFMVFWANLRFRFRWNSFYFSCSFRFRFHINSLRVVLFFYFLFVSSQNHLKVDSKIYSL